MSASSPIANGLIPNEFESDAAIIKAAAINNLLDGIAIQILDVVHHLILPESGDDIASQHNNALPTEAAQSSLAPQSELDNKHVSDDSIAPKVLTFDLLIISDELAGQHLVYSLEQLLKQQDNTAQPSAHKNSSPRLADDTDDTNKQEDSKVEQTHVFHYLEHSFKIHTISIEPFLTLPFSQRYDLACFISPDITSVATLSRSILAQADLSQTDKAYSLQSSETIALPETQLLPQPQLHSIAVRLRDLFAKQSVIYLPKVIKNTAGNVPINPVNKDKLIDLGYIQNDFTEMGVSLTQSNSLRPFVTCWQFNLYDYKPAPDWLNARFWANPENYHKYRW